MRPLSTFQGNAYAVPHPHHHLCCQVLGHKRGYVASNRGRVGQTVVPYAPPLLPQLPSWMRPLSTFQGIACNSSAVSRPQLPACLHWDDKCDTGTAPAGAADNVWSSQGHITVEPRWPRGPGNKTGPSPVSALPLGFPAVQLCTTALVWICVDVLAVM